MLTGRINNTVSFQTTQCAVLVPRSSARASQARILKRWQTASINTCSISSRHNRPLPYSPHCSGWFMVTGCQTHIRVARSCLLEPSSSSCASEVAPEKKTYDWACGEEGEGGIVSLWVIDQRDADWQRGGAVCVRCYPATLLRNRVHVDVRSRLTDTRPPVPAAEARGRECTETLNAARCCKDRHAEEKRLNHN